MPNWTTLLDTLRAAGLEPDAAAAPRPVAGGDISAAWRLETRQGSVFLKTGDAASRRLFDAEASGLRQLAGAGAVRVPTVLATGSEGGTAFLALEWLPFERATPAIERRLGEQLAQLHRCVGERFGAAQDNFIGLTPQPNAWSESWPDFYRQQRLGHQLQLAAANGHGAELQDSGLRLGPRLPDFFADYDPVPSLLHGDLWGGNWAACEGRPAVFDPAVYYGDRETDLAMTRLFGGFGRDFYAAYEASWPLAPGHEARSDLYQLYHVLNHLNLFGGAYLGRARQLIGRLLAY